MCAQGEEQVRHRGHTWDPERPMADAKKRKRPPGPLTELKTASTLVRDGMSRAPPATVTRLPPFQRGSIGTMRVVGRTASAAIGFESSSRMCTISFFRASTNTSTSFSSSGSQAEPSGRGSSGLTNSNCRGAGRDRLMSCGERSEKREEPNGQAK